MPSLNSALDAWRLLKGHAECTSEIPHLRELMADAKRCEKMFAGHDGITLDYSRQARQPRLSTRAMRLEKGKPRCGASLAPGARVALAQRARAGVSSPPTRAAAALRFRRRCLARPP
jgi:hypothetical protein